MSTPTDIELARNPSASATQLAEMVGLREEVDQIVAMHANASSEVLQLLANSEDQKTLLNICGNPNITSGIIFTLDRYKEVIDWIHNPAIELIVIEEPDMLCDISRKALMDLACPQWLLNSVGRNSVVRDQLLAILCNLTIENELREYVLEKLEIIRCEWLHSYRDQIENEISRRVFDSYSAITLPYCVPRFSALDRTNLSHRRADMLGGFPFTSTAHPWPVCSRLRRPKQPICQIDLARAGMHLGLELGDELLQVWQNVLPENWPFVGGAVGTGRDAGCTEAPELQLRLVPTIDAQSQPDWKYPEDAPWDIPAEDLDREHTCLLWLTREQIAKPRIDWSPAGLMHPLSSASFMDSNGIEVGLWDVEGIDHLDLQGDRNNPKPTPSCETYLGGFGGDGGGQTDPYPFQFEDGGHGQLLMNFVSAEDDGAMFAIFFRSNQLGRIEFGAIYYRYS